MEMKQLQYFLTTVQAGSITRAAEVLYITQPALTRTLKRLEDELGFALFERRHSGLLLTEAGQIMAKGAGQMLSTLESSVHTAKQAAGVLAERISIACAYEEFDNSLIYDLQEHYPTLRINFNVVLPRQALAQVVSGEADFALLPGQNLPDNLRCINLIREEMAFSPAKGHPLFGRRQLALQELGGCSVVCNNASFDEDLLSRLLSENGIQMDILFSGNDHHQVGVLKYAMHSALFVPMSALLDHSRQLDSQGVERWGAPETPARILPPVFQRQIDLVYRADRRLHSSDLYLISSLKNHYAELEDRLAAQAAEWDSLFPTE